MHETKVQESGFESDVLRIKSLSTVKNKMLSEPSLGVVQVFHLYCFKEVVFNYFISTQLRVVSHHLTKQRVVKFSTFFEELFPPQFMVVLTTLTKIKGSSNFPSF